MNEDVLNLIKSLGVGYRHPKDEFFRDGNQINKVHKVFGVYEVDEEEFYHKAYSTFACHVPGCKFVCMTVYEYDQHYNSCHRFTCSECNKYLPSSYLLDLHLMETHDSYFAALSEKKPMFQCYIQECKSVFKTPHLRRDHCISEHKFPSNFRFDDLRKSKASKNKHMKNKKKYDNDVEMGEQEGTDIVKMELSSEINVSKSKSNIKKMSKPGNKMKPKLDMDCFVKDMKNSLPS